MVWPSGTIKPERPKARNTSSQLPGKTMTIQHPIRQGCQEATIHIIWFRRGRGYGWDALTDLKAVKRIPSDTDIPS